MLLIDVQNKQLSWNLNLESKASKQTPYIPLMFSRDCSFAFQTQKCGLEFYFKKSCENKNVYGNGNAFTLNENP